MLFLLYSCGVERHKASGVDGRQSLSVGLSEETVLTPSNFSIAHNICQSFRSKKISLRSYYLGQLFDFSVKRETCAGKLEEEEFKATLIADDNLTPMKFDGLISGEAFTNVITHEVGFLSPICEDVLKGNSEIKNQYIKNGIIYQLLFSSSSREQAVFKVYEYLEEDTTVPHAFYQFKVRLDDKFGSNTRGIIYSYFKSQRCNNGKTYEMTQSLNSITNLSSTITKSL